MRSLIAGTVVCVLILIGASSASAATRYVATSGDNSGTCTNPASPCATIPYAVDAAADGDTIQIAAGEYLGTVFAVGKSLNYAGAGPSTVIRGGAGTAESPGGAGMILNAGGTVRSLKVEGGNGGLGAGQGASGGIGIFVSTTNPAVVAIEDVEAVGGTGGPGTSVGSGGMALLASSPAPITVTARDSSFEEGVGRPGLAAVTVGAGADVTISDSSISGDNGVNIGGGAEANLIGTSVEADYGVAVTSGSVHLDRSRIGAVSEGLQLYSESSSPTSATVVDSLVTSAGPAASLFSGGADGKAVSLTARGSTLVGSDTAVVLAVAGAADDGPVTVDLHNSVAHYTVLPGETPFDLLAVRGTITADHSAFKTSSGPNGGSVPAPGSGTNISADPLFVGAAAGDYRLRPDSPLIDRGDPGIVVPGELDLAGAPRSLDADGDCTSLPIPDIGAYELVAPTPMCALPAPPGNTDVAPAVSAFGLTNRTFAPKGGTKERRKRAHSSARRKGRVKRGTRFKYTLSEPARVKITIERKKAKGKGKRRFARVGSLNGKKTAGRQSTKFSGRLLGKALKPGRYRATIVATDAGGQASKSRQVSFRIVRG